jgi:hypothetical protein
VKIRDVAWAMTSLATWHYYVCERVYIIDAAGSGGGLKSRKRIIDSWNGIAALLEPANFKNKMYVMWPVEGRGRVRN